MIKNKYLQQVTKKVIQLNQSKNLKFFIYGSSLSKKHFGDLDIGVMGEVKDRELAKLKEEFAASTLP